jgi:hypothetical protein
LWILRKEKRDDIGKKRLVRESLGGMIERAVGVG